MLNINKIFPNIIFLKQPKAAGTPQYTHTHTHAHNIYIYIYFDKNPTYIRLQMAFLFSLQMEMQRERVQATHGQAVGAVYNHHTADTHHLTWRSLPTLCTYPTTPW